MKSPAGKLSQTRNSLISRAAYCLLVAALLSRPAVAQTEKEDFERRLELIQAEHKKEIEQKNRVIDGLELEVRTEREQRDAQAAERDRVEWKLIDKQFESTTNQTLADLNWYWPGAGFIATGQGVRGIVYATGLGVLLTGTVFSALETWRLRDDVRGREWQIRLGLSSQVPVYRQRGAEARTQTLAFGALVWYLASLYDGHKFGINRTPAFSPGRRIEYEGPGAAFVAPPSFSVPQAEFEFVAWRWRF